MKLRLNLNKQLTLTALVGFALSGYSMLSADSRTLDLSPFQVIGSKENLLFTPGAGYYVDDNEIVLHGYDNIEQIMRRVPGVYFRTEDGFGLFPNISFRGVGSMRTTKLTVMEDGILSAPAPYSNPAAYYTPTTGRMSGVEILKGSSQIEYGPHTTGGVLNYLSTPLPTERKGRVRLSFGDNQDMRFHGYFGDTFQSDLGEFAVLFEMYYRKNDGFKSIDTSPTFAGGDTGFKKTEPMLKIGWKPNTTVQQQLELKVGYTDMSAEETYLGLTEEDFRADPYRRYVSSQFDTIPTEHWRTYLSHQIRLNSDIRLNSRVYYNQFSRAWYKLHDVRRIGGGAASLAEALAGGGFSDGSGPIAGTEGEPLRVLRGEAAGIWRVRDNNRDYKSYGAESVLQYTVEVGNTTHFIEAGLRLHEDYEDRFQKQDDYTVDDSGNVTGVQMRQGGTQDNRRGTSRALAFHLRDRIVTGALTVSPGIRFERIRYLDKRRGTNPNSADFNQVISSTKGTLNVFAPGISLLYDATETVSFFSSVHKGFSLPSPGAATGNNPLKEETSIGLEAGMRYQNGQGVRAELVAFHTDFENLIVPDNIGGAGTGQTENAGDVRSYGFEAALAWDPARANDWGFNLPLQLAFTYTDATIRSDVSASGTSGGAVESIFAGGQRGNRLPYIPRYQISVSSGIEFEKLGIYLDAFYVPSTYASANNSASQINPVGGPGNTPIADARFGKSDAYFLLDLTVRYRLTNNIALNIGAQNLLDRKYMASRLPHGPRPGHSRFISAGIIMDF